MRRLLVAALVALLLLSILAWGVQQMLHEAPRTPGEMIDYAERRLRTQPRLRHSLLPLLEATRRALGEPGPMDRLRPLAVPPLAPNPLTPPAHDPARVQGQRVIRVGPTRALKRVADAARLATDGSLIEIDPGDYVADVAVWDRASLTIRGLGERVRLIANGASAEGKAIWVIRRGDVTVENIEFFGVRVGDRNGAGIRLEAGHLTVRDCVFLDSDSGILTSGDPSARLSVERSEFGYLGSGDGFSHAIYVGAIDRFELRDSYLHHGNMGHLVKSRARRNRIEYNRISDEASGRASYEVDLPNGGDADLVGNLIEQGDKGASSVLVSYGEEGYAAMPNALRMAFNTVINDGHWGSTFVRVATGADSVSLRDNLWVGGGRIEVPPGSDEAANRKVQRSGFALEARQDYRPRESVLGASPPAPVDEDLQPHWEYVHPMKLEPLESPARFPGAIQSSVP